VKTYLFRRTFNLIPTLLLVSIAVFAAIRFLPGDPIYSMALVRDGLEVDREHYERLKKLYGMDRPMVVQYGQWLWDVVRGDWGASLFNRKPVFPQMVSRISFTAQLALLSWCFSLLVGVPLGIVAALKRNSLPDVGATAFAMAGVALPNFWLGLMLLIFFGVWLGWVPIGGYVSFFESPLEWFRRMALPTVTLGTGLVAVLARQTRSAMLEVLAEDYVRTARAKGLNPFRVVGVHALKNALLPVVTVSSLQLGGLMGGAVVTESVFVLPGVGKFVVDAVFDQDYLIVQLGILVITLGVLLANFIADLLYAYLDPRIRYS
jgi:peptide/nickel transport system permease protein